MSAAVCFSPERNDASLIFGMRPGTYNTEAIIEFLDALHDHLGGDRITLVWDGLPRTGARP